MIAPARCTGAIIAGGRATRFGGVAKGLERVGGERIIDRVARALAGSCDELVIVANDKDAAAWIPGVRVVRDIRTNAGALGGIHAALTNASGAVLVLPWDMPFVPAELLHTLRLAGEADGVDAAMPISNSRWGFEPLCACYSPTCVPAIEQKLNADELASGAWQPMVNAVRVDVSRWGNPDEIFFNVNTAEDLAVANAKLL